MIWYYLVVQQIAGAITSYLIILIQFNVAAQHIRIPGNVTDLYDNQTLITAEL